jgi:hypothetical protein
MSSSLNAMGAVLFEKFFRPYFRNRITDKTCQHHHKMCVIIGTFCVFIVLIVEKLWYYTGKKPTLFPTLKWFMYKLHVFRMLKIHEWKCYPLLFAYTRILLDQLFDIITSNWCILIGIHAVLLFKISRVISGETERVGEEVKIQTLFLEVSGSNIGWYTAILTEGFHLFPSVRRDKYHDSTWIRRRRLSSKSFTFYR